MYPTAEKLLNAAKSALERLGISPESYEYDLYAQEISIALLRELATHPDDMVVHWAARNPSYADASAAIFTESLKYLVDQIEQTKESDAVS